MIDFNGTKIEKDKLIVNAKVESEIINDVDIYKDVYLKNIKVYTPDNYPDSSKYLIDADNEDSYNGDSTSGDLGTVIEHFTPNGYQLTGDPIILQDINLSVTGSSERIESLEIPRTLQFVNNKYTLRELYYNAGNTFDDKIASAEWISVYNYQVTPQIINVITDGQEEEYLVFYMGTDDTPEQYPIFLTLKAIYNPIQLYTALKENYPLDSENFVHTYDCDNPNVGYISGDTVFNNSTIFGIPLSHYTQRGESESTVDYTEKEYEHTFKDLRFQNTPQAEMDFTKEILIVEANVEGSPDITTPCGKDLTKEIFVVYDKKIPYKQAMGYLKSIGGCEPSKEFMDFILRLKSLELSVEACNYQQAAYIWKWFTNNAADPCGVKIKSNCNCHG